MYVCDMDPADVLPGMDDDLNYDRQPFAPSDIVDARKEMEAWLRFREDNRWRSRYAREIKALTLSGELGD